MIKYIKNEIKLIKEKDPSVKTNLEALLHPTFKIKIYYRIANYFYKKKHFFLGRLIQNMGKKRTGIEIHSGATIGKNFFIDHGTGVVIGETAIIGDNVTIFHGVTLGTTGKEIGKRHPTVGNNVLIGANATVLGNITIGDNAKVGAGAVVVKDVLKNTTVVGIPAKKVNKKNPKNRIVRLKYSKVI